MDTSASLSLWGAVWAPPGRKGRETSQSYAHPEGPPGGQWGLVRLPGWSCQIKSSAGCPVESALRKNNKECFSRSLPCVVFDVLFLCVFICRLFAKSGTLPKQGGGREGAGSGRAERPSEAEREGRAAAGRALPAGLKGAGEGGSLACGAPRSRAATGSRLPRPQGAAVCPSASPGVRHQSPTRTCRAQRTGRETAEPRAAPDRPRVRLGGDQSASRLPFRLVGFYYLKQNPRPKSKHKK